ncbi:hypothetical protein F5876DRAFT_73777 [Lentinula aff. lateritia]|uniref:Uncharacterized protein n=1 Tax=Lentinula aff. lateritia TaxID=2804960 RepID=A0ACC1U9N5_9AGAR|nr:hypothetical protein F5876DRAFT_73777 [Lentinula aff. lateritia]
MSANLNIPSPTSEPDEPGFGEQSLSSTPTPSSHVHRSLSQSGSQSFSNQIWSAADTPSHHYQGTSYFSAPRSPSTSRQAPPPPILMRSSSAHSTHSMRRGVRSTSVSSTARGGFRDDEAFSEADEYEGDNGEENRKQRRSGGGGSKAVSVDDEPHEDSDEQPSSEQDSTGKSDDEPDPITLKERQSLINVEHPFGLPIWKPALYKKSRSVTRYADEALHSVPSAQAERHLLPGNLLWVIIFGWWLALVCWIVSAFLYIVPKGGKRYANLVFGLGWYIAWPFGKYVEGIADDLDQEDNDEDGHDDEADAEATPNTDEDSDAHERRRSSGSSNTVRGVSAEIHHHPNPSWIPTEHTSLISTTPTPLPAKSYGALSATPSSSTSSIGLSKHATAPDDHFLAKAAFWTSFVFIIAPLMLIVCLICWFFVFTIPMAKLTWALIKHIFEQPQTIRFCAAPLTVVVDTIPASSPELDQLHEQAYASSESAPAPGSRLSVKHTIKPTRLTKGQRAPSGSPCTAVLLCTYRALGLKYYKYTVGGVNIMFVNLLAVVFFAIFDWAVLLAWVEELEEHGRVVPSFLAAVANQGVIFVLSLLSVIPLSYFIGMAVASISAQSSIGMGAVINATFGSIIEILLYSIALSSGKGRLVEGSIVGSLLAGVLLMPGTSMMSSALRRKEVKFNAKSAGVTSMMLIMAIVGALTPTLFYQVYGTFQLVCTGCPSNPSAGDSNKPWSCDQCYFQHPDPVHDPFYQSTVKSLMFFCAAVLILSYLIGLWFSLRTHASQIWQNPQQLLNPLDLPLHNPSHSQHPQQAPGHLRQSLYHKLVPANVQRTLSHRASAFNIGGGARPQTPVTPLTPGGTQRRPASPVYQRRVSYAPVPTSGVPTIPATAIPTLPQTSSLAPPTSASTSGYAPILESVDQAVKNSNINSLQLPETMTTDEFTRAVAVATVSALRHQQQSTQVHSPARLRASGLESEGVAGHGGHGGAVGGHGGHDAPSWSRFTSASVLLSCTALYAVIAEILVDVIDVILGDSSSGGSAIDEKFLGVTLLALVPNTTEFMNAISFALNGNIALSMEIGSAYALQVCLLQIPAMVAFSAWWFPERMGEVAYTFSLIFPRWDVIALILAMFLLTYTYIEAKSNYHRGSILILSYLVLIAGFYYAPRAEEMLPEVDPSQNPVLGSSVSASYSNLSMQQFDHLTFWEYVRWYLSGW